MGDARDQSTLEKCLVELEAIEQFNARILSMMSKMYEEQKKQTELLSRIEYSERTRP